MPQHGLLFEKLRQSFHQNAGSVGRVLHVKKEPLRSVEHTRRVHLTKKLVRVKEKIKISSEQVHDVYNDVKNVAGSVVVNVRRTPLERFILLMDLYIPYVDIAFLDRMLKAAMVIATMNYFKKNIVNFTMPISVSTHTRSNILYERPSDTTEALLWTTVKGSGASMNCRLVMYCSLNMARKNLLQFFKQHRSSNKNRPRVPVW